MDTRQPPAPNSYPPAAPWVGGPSTARGQPPPGYPGGAWPAPPSQPPPQAPRKRGARAAFVGLGALLIVGMIVAATAVVGPGDKRHDRARYYGRYGIARIVRGPDSWVMVRTRWSVPVAG